MTMCSLNILVVEKLVVMSSNSICGFLITTRVIMMVKGSKQFSSSVVMVNRAVGGFTGLFVLFNSFKLSKKEEFIL